MRLASKCVRKANSTSEATDAVPVKGKSTTCAWITSEATAKVATPMTNQISARRLLAVMLEK